MIICKRTFLSLKSYVVVFNLPGVVHKGGRYLLYCLVYIRLRGSRGVCFSPAKHGIKSPKT